MLKKRPPSAGGTDAFKILGLSAALLGGVIGEVQGKKAETPEGAEAVTSAETRERTQKVLEKNQGPFELTNEVLAEEGVKPALIESANKYPGLKWIGKLEGNGRRDVLIYVPEGINPNEPIEIVYHFHGTNGELLNESYPKLEGTSSRYNGWVKRKKIATTGVNRLEQVLEATKKAGEAHKNRITVYPLSAGQRAKPGTTAWKNAYDARWMRKGKNGEGDDMEKLHHEVEEMLSENLGSLPKDIKITVKGHSAGGLPLMNIASSGFPVDRYDFLDAGYGNWAQICYKNAVAANSKVEMNVFYVPTANATTKSAKSLEGKPGVKIIEADCVHGEMNGRYFNWERKD